MKARREIADYMKSGRIERARIRVSVPVTTAVIVYVPWYCSGQGESTRAIDTVSMPVVQGVVE